MNVGEDGQGRDAGCESQTEGIKGRQAGRKGGQYRVGIRGVA